MRVKRSHATSRSWIQCPRQNGHLHSVPPFTVTAANRPVFQPSEPKAFSASAPASLLIEDGDNVVGEYEFRAVFTGPID